MPRWSVGLVVGAFVLAGCGAPKTPDSKSSTAPSASASQGSDSSDPAQTLYEKLHGGAFQVSSALDNLHEATEALRPLLKTESGETKEALLDLLDTLDSSARSLSDYSESPTREEVAKDLASAERLRKKESEEVVDALREIREAKGVLSDMVNSAPPEPEKSAVERADGAVQEAQRAVEDAIELLGDKIPKDEVSR